MIFGKTTEAIFILVYEVVEGEDIYRGKIQSSAYPEIGDVIMIDKGKVEVLETGLACPEGFDKFYPYVLTKLKYSAQNLDNVVDAITKAGKDAKNLKNELLKKNT